jgi:membrane protease YdiL (CAAX protease family)
MGVMRAAQPVRPDPPATGVGAVAPPAWVATPRQAVLFCAVAFGATWALFVPFVLGGVRWGSEEAQPLQALGIAAPSVTAFVFTALIAGRGGVRRLWQQGTRWRAGAGWYAFVVAGPGVAVGAGLVVTAALGVPPPLASPPVGAVVAAVVVGLLAGTFEEFGWSGFAFPALQARYGLAAAGGAVGVAVALWHLPFFFAPGTTQAASSFPYFLVQLIPARILAGWVYNGGGGSVLLAILFHGFWNAWGEALGTGPMVADPFGLTQTALLSAAAVAVMLVPRLRDRRRPAPRAASVGPGA